MKKIQKKRISQDLAGDLNITNTWQKIIICMIIFSTIIYLSYIIYTSYHTNGYFSFPLDDPWIHLQFAKNFYQYGEFSYYKDSLVTSGSTAPLYTFLLSLGFVFSNNEFILSYLSGILFFAGSIVFFSKLLSLEFNNNNLITILGTFLFAFFWKFQWAAISGMETTTALFFLLGTIYFYKIEKWLPFFIIAGALLWIRPEAIILYAVLLADIFYHKNWIKEKNRIVGFNPAKKKTLFWFSIFALIILSYFLFNAFLSGSIFPNTFSAKIKYYSGGNVNYLKQLWNLFTEKDILILTFFSLIGFFTVLYKIISREKNKMLLYSGWALGMIIAYGLFLPFLYHKGRYLFPIFPAYLILSLYGLVYIMNILKHFVKFFAHDKKYLYTVILLLIIVSVQFLMASSSLKEIYIDDVKYIHDRQITTAKWLDKNLPGESIIATHDIGAIAYYSNRPVVDMVGLVSPEMIPKIGSFTGLKEFLNSKNVTHVAVLRNWFHIGNQNPIFITDENNPEVMEVFEYKKNSDFVPQNIVGINEAAEYFLRAGNVQQALALLQQSLTLYPDLDWTNFLIGKCLVMTRDYNKAKVFLVNSLKLNPQHLQAKKFLEKLN